MMKMLIELDSEKICREQKYDLTELENCIERLFTDEGMHRDSNGCFVDGDFVSIGAIVLALRHTGWFMENVKTWLWYELERETTNPTDDDYSVEDVLAEFRAIDKKQMAG